MKAPRFWSNRKNWIIPAALSPLAMIYRLSIFVNRLNSKNITCSIPIVCAGNIVTGGAGKTPTAIAIAKLLADMGQTPHFLSRGYRGKISGPTLVDREIHDSSMVGDEALLLAKIAPTWISCDREKGASAATNAGASIIIMDDGHQNHDIIKDLSIIVIDGGFGFGNSRLIPSGPLRESLKSGIIRADAVVIIGQDKYATKEKIKNYSLPIIDADIFPVAKDTNIETKSVIAFAGIGRPEKFFDTLDFIGCEIIKKYTFSDHYNYKPKEIDRLASEAEKYSATLVTTEKDWIRIEKNKQNLVMPIPIELKWKDANKIKDLLNELFINT
tara:strand:+ start:21023 stop:22006 length:984 start_codon:yes stop_codon:yes gene_type:complete